MKWKCPYCDKELIKDDIFSGACPKCKKVIDFPFVEKVAESPTTAEVPETPILQENKTDKYVSFAVSQNETIRQIKRGLKWVGIIFAGLFVFTLLLAVYLLTFWHNFAPKPTCAFSLFRVMFN